MEPSRRTFLKAAAVGAGALWAHPARAGAKYEVRVHFLGLFVALKNGSKSYIASVNDLSGTHLAHSVFVAVDPGNYKEGGIGALACDGKVKAFRIANGELKGPDDDDDVILDYPTENLGECPKNKKEWRNPRWHVKLAAVGAVHRTDWIKRDEVDVRMKVESNAIEAEPPLIASVRRLKWKVGKTTQALTDRLLYVVKTDEPKFKFKSGTLQLQAVGNQPIHVYVLTVPITPTLTPAYKKGDKLPHFAIGHSLLASGTPIPEADEPCTDVFETNLPEPQVITDLYDCLFPMLETQRLKMLEAPPKDRDSEIPFELSKTVFCPGYSNP